MSIVGAYGTTGVFDTSSSDIPERWRRPEECGYSAVGDVLSHLIPRPASIPTSHGTGKTSHERKVSAQSRSQPVQDKACGCDTGKRSTGGPRPVGKEGCGGEEEHEAVDSELTRTWAHKHILRLM